VDLNDVYRIFHHATAQCPFSSEANGSFSKLDHILEQKANLNKYKKIKIIPAFYLITMQIKLELNKSNS
jgi:hypothetical protein